MMVKLSSHLPLIGHLELTYRCNLDCIHCYCKGSENKDKELSTKDWKQIIDQLHKAGCLWIILTGGEPLVREDFLEIYNYVKEKRIFIILFTNGLEINTKIIDYFKKLPPYLIEITLPAISPTTYQIITKNRGAFKTVIANINMLAKNNLPFLLKTNALKQNKNELKLIKKFNESLLNIKGLYKRHYFKCDPFIYPRLDGDKSPLQYRLSPHEILELASKKMIVFEKSNKKINIQYSKKKQNNYLYPCAYSNYRFWINPYGILKYCCFMHKFNVDLKEIPFLQGFHNISYLIKKERTISPSTCQLCKLKDFCFNCPTKAYIETGKEDNSVIFYCALAKMSFASVCTI